VSISGMSSLPVWLTCWTFTTLKTYFTVPFFFSMPSPSKGKGSGEFTFSLPNKPFGRCTRHQAFQS
jgi:hypothetical protein